METTFTSQDQYKLAYTFLCLETCLLHSGRITITIDHAMSPGVLAEGETEDNLSVAIKFKNTVLQHILRYYAGVERSHETL